jgi:hypothetical protein
MTARLILLVLQGALFLYLIVSTIVSVTYLAWRRWGIHKK